MLRVINIGPLALPGDLVVLLVAFALGAELVGREARRRRLPVAAFNNGGTLALLLGILGARLGYALLHWDAYADAPGGLLALNAQALSAPIGLAMGLGVWLGYVGWRGVPPRVALDALAPGIGVLGLGFALAHAANGSLFGTPSDAPWAVELWGASRHPTQLYAAVWALVLLLTWPRWRDGAAFAWMTGGLAAGWLVVGLWLAEPETLPGGVRTVQAVAWALLAACAGWAISGAASRQPQTDVRGGQ
ncbi:MAG: prolipoprotein diacylglyceryl transferase family protein [Anaerolineales bacterium]